jgi:hypothetical protein
MRVIQGVTGMRRDGGSGPHALSQTRPNPELLCDLFRSAGAQAGAAGAAKAARSRGGAPGEPAEGSQRPTRALSADCTM